MNFINKLTNSIIFRENKSFIEKRFSKLCKNLETWEFNLSNTTNQIDDYINCMLIEECLAISTDCKFSIKIIKGKLKGLKPANQKQEEIKTKIVNILESLEKKYNNLNTELNNHELIIQLKSSLAV